MTSQPLRKPKYIGRNGFTEFNPPPPVPPGFDTNRVNDTKVTTHTTVEEFIASIKAQPPPPTALEREAAHRAELRDFVLAHRGVYFNPDGMPKEPTYEEMMEQHDAQLDALFDLQAAQYWEERKAHYYALAGRISPSEDDPGYTPPTDQWADAVERLTYVQHKEMEPYWKQRRVFPRDKDAWKASGREVQMRAARVLVAADDKKREALLDEYGWAWRQVQPLVDEFKSDAEFRKAVQAKAAEPEVRDPRKRPSTSAASPAIAQRN